ncbi:breast carcinoma-amplified sequence 1 isoform X2 [Stigmatopora argus]
MLNSDLVESNSQHFETEDGPEKLAANPKKEEVKREEKVPFFDKIFKKKDLEAPVNTESVAEKHENVSNVSCVPANETQLETANQKQEALTEAEVGTTDHTDNANSTSAETETNSEESPVMNFFKNLMTPTKTSKKETPEVPKDQRQRENQSATTTTVAQISDPPAASKGMLIPPPPPPELPKVEVKAEPGSKSAKPTTSKEKTKAVAKSAESPKSAKDVLSKFFRPKTNKETELQAAEVEVISIVEKQEMSDDVQQAVIEVEAEEPQQTPKKAALVIVVEKMMVAASQPEVENEVDPSKAGTLEATARPEPPPPVHEEKNMPSKSSFLSFFKPKASEPKKSRPDPAKAAEATAVVKAKEEPKATVKSLEMVVDDKVTSVAPKTADGVPSVARKPEKRNSIQLFLKHLGQKRHSTDAGVQTEPLNVAAAAK